MSPHTVTGHFYQSWSAPVAAAKKMSSRSWGENTTRPREETYNGLHVRFFLQHFPCLCRSSKKKIHRQNHMASSFFESTMIAGERSRTRSHSLRTSSSASCLQLIRFSIHPSSVGIDPGSVVGDRWWGSGERAASISMLLSIAAATRNQRGDSRRFRDSSRGGAETWDRDGLVRQGFGSFSGREQ